MHTKFLTFQERLLWFVNHYKTVSGKRAVFHVLIFAESKVLELI